MDYLTGMVYDRTQADVDAGNSKGFWNISDINRVESKEKEIADYLGITITYKTWSLGDLISLGDIQTILNDIQRMRNAWHTASDTPATPTQNAGTMPVPTTSRRYYPICMTLFYRFKATSSIQTKSIADRRLSYECSN
jgi:hypothetical protein